MLIFFHLFSGLIIGILLAIGFSNRRAVLFSAFGAILPDLIDKPLGHIILAETLDWGRIYFHSLTFFLIFLIAGLLLWLYNEKRIGIFCVAVGIFLHQFGDFMYDSLQNWLWPLFGDFASGKTTYPELTGAEWLIEITTWLTAIAIAAFVIAALYLHFRHAIETSRAKIAAALSGGALFGIILAFGLVFLLGILLAGSSAGTGYFDKMLLHELVSLSEWMFGIASLAILLVLFYYPARISKRHAVFTLKCFGIFLFAIGAAIPVMWSFGLQVDYVYGETAQLLAVFGLVLGGIALYLSSAKFVEAGVQFPDISEEKDPLNF